MALPGMIDEVRIYKALPSAEDVLVLSCPIHFPESRRFHRQSGRRRSG